MAPTNNDFRYYMHEGAESISFELSGRLLGDDARELEHARRAVDRTRSLIVDLSYVTQVDKPGQKLLRRWYEDGAQLVANSPSASAIATSITGKNPEFVTTVARNQTWLPFRTVSLWALALMILFATARTNAASLKIETIETWNEYVKAALARNEQRFGAGSPFLSADESGETARLRGGEIVVSPINPNIPMKVPSGLIHDWTGAIFIPGVALPDVLRVVRDYPNYRFMYQPYVLDSKPGAATEKEDLFSMLLMNKSVIAKVALDSDYRSVYTRLDDRRCYSVTEATRIQEVADYGTPSQHRLPPSQGTGLMWKLLSMTRFEERDGGVYIEIEVLVLSRDVPASLRWLVDPIVRRISRSSLVTSLQQTKEAVRSGAASITRAADHALPPSVNPARSFR